MSLTVREKEHWKESIDRKVKRAINDLYAQAEPGFMERIEKESKRRALESLGVLELQTKLDSIKTNIRDLEKERDAVSNKVIEKLKAECPEFKPSYDYQYSVDGAADARKRQFRRDLLSEHPLGRQILSLESEQEELLDTVWLATSSIQIKELWNRVSTLLDQPPTGLQREALAIPGDASPPKE